MNCSNCNTLNNVGSKFCIKCGHILQDPQGQTETVFQEVPISNIDILSTSSTPITKVSIMECFSIILAVILKPFTALQEKLNKFNELKNSAILALVVSVVATLINLIKTMLNEVIVKKLDWLSGRYETTWVWENLKEIDYLEVVGKNFLIYLGVIVAISVVYYIASLIIKKEAKFSRLLGISAIAVAPMLICSLILSPLLSLIWNKLTIPIIIVGAIYTIILLYEGINNEVLLKDNTKYYFNLICFSILGIALYYLYIKVLMTSIYGSIDIFG